VTELSGKGGAAGTTVELVAEESFAVLGSVRQVEPFSTRHPGFGLGDAYRVTAIVRGERERRGERPVGRKIGFTNRTIWPEYDVYAPMWGYIYDRTVFDLATDGAAFPLSGLAEPRIEPEIVFGLAHAPAPGMSAHALLGCVGWVAHGVELVQSIFPDWKFVAADTIAAYGLHGALLIGARHPIAPRIADWERELSSFEIDLYRNGQLADRGRAANVLDGPVLALRHLVDLLASDTANPSLAAGEIVTTGTLTRAFPVVAGEVWTSRLTGVPLEGARIRFV
jgi:2-oxo-3-hexenedioate decarboxylase